MITFKQLGNLGRFGNQLFQIASTIGIAYDNNELFGFPTWQYQNNFLRPLPEIDNKINYTPYHYLDYPYKKIVGKNLNLYGYFQSEKYFKDYRDIIQHYFQFKNDFTYNDPRSVSVHIRRGDYVSFPNVFKLLDKSYYLQAFKYFGTSYNFYIFSDDNFASNCILSSFLSEWNIKFVTGNDDIMDFTFMKNCKHHIMANSSYSWWAAWLGGGEVVTPAHWTFTESDIDRTPMRWVKIEN